MERVRGRYESGVFLRSAFFGFPCASLPSSSGSRMRFFDSEASSTVTARGAVAGAGAGAGSSVVGLGASWEMADEGPGRSAEGSVVATLGTWLLES